MLPSSERVPGVRMGMDLAQVACHATTRNPMQPRIATRLLAPLLLATFTSTAQADVSLFEGTPGGAGNVRIYDETGATPPRAPAELQGITLLPIDAASRSLLEALRSDRPRLGADIPGAQRVILPFEQGSLYRYRRDGTLGATFGYFVIGTDGAARRVFEIAGTGLAGADDPIPGCVGVDPSGQALLVGTTVAAGGNLIEIDLALGTSIDRTATLDPVSTLFGGARLLSTWGIALSTRGALRFDRTNGASASFVPLPLGADALAFVGDGVAVSADETTAAFVGGDSATAAHVLTFRSTGGATRATTTPSAIQGAGYLPTFPHGPTLAVSADGTAVAWRTEGATTEAWVRQLAPGAAPAFQVTDDAHFEDTLGETGAIGFIAGTLILLVGSVQGVIGGAPTGIEGGDIFQVIPITNEVVNLSLTSGQALTPFPKGGLDTDNGIWELPDGSGIVALHDFGADGEVLTVPWTGAPTVVLDQVKSVESIALAGSNVVLGVRRTNAERTTDLVHVPMGVGSTANVISTFSKDCDLERFQGRSDGRFTAVLDCLGAEWLGHASFPSASGSLLTNQPLVYGPTFAFPPTGSVAGSLEFPSRTVFFTWSGAGAPKLLVRWNGPGYVLPGA